MRLGDVSRVRRVCREWRALRSAVATTARERNAARSIAHCATRKGSLDHLKDIYALFGPSVWASLYSDTFLFDTACEYGHLAVAEWLESKCGPRYVRPDIVLWRTTIRGHLAVLQWLVGRHGADIDAVRGGAKAMLETACAYGHLSVVQWLVARFELAVADVHGADRGALALACRNGCAPVVRWLVERFGISADALCAHGDPLGGAIDIGSIELVQWLLGRFEVTAADTGVLDGALRRACGQGQHKLARWLAAHFGIPVLAPARRRELLELACEGCHLEVVQWLTEHAPLTAAERMRALHLARGRGFGRLLAWLLEG